MHSKTHSIGISPKKVFDVSPRTVIFFLNTVLIYLNYMYFSFMNMIIAHKYLEKTNFDRPKTLVLNRNRRNFFK